MQPAKENSYTLQRIPNVEEEEQESQDHVNKTNYGSKLHPIELDVDPPSNLPDTRWTLDNPFPGNDTNMQDRDRVDPALRELEYLDDEQSANPTYEQDAHMQGTSPPGMPDDSAYDDDPAQQQVTATNTNTEVDIRSRRKLLMDAMVQRYEDMGRCNTTIEECNEKMARAHGDFNQIHAAIGMIIAELRGLDGQESNSDAEADVLRVDE